MKRLLLVLALVLALTGCGIPHDPDETLKRIDTTHVVRVGVSHAPPWTDITGSAPAGREVDLVTDWARTRGARVEWTIGGEEQLVAQMEEGHLDLVVGGITKDSPWQKKAAITRPWTVDTDDARVKHEHILLAPLGENALVSSLETFFDKEAR